MMNSAFPPTHRDCSFTNSILPENRKRIKNGELDSTVFP